MAEPGIEQYYVNKIEEYEVRGEKNSWAYTLAQHSFLLPTGLPTVKSRREGTRSSTIGSPEKSAKCQRWASFGRVVPLKGINKRLSALCGSSSAQGGVAAFARAGQLCWGGGEANGQEESACQGRFGLIDQLMEGAVLRNYTVGLPNGTLSYLSTQALFVCIMFFLEGVQAHAGVWQYFVLCTPTALSNNIFLSLFCVA